MREVSSAIQRARERGVAVGTVGRDVETTRALLSYGVNFILSGASILLAAASRSYLEGVRA
jgi:2-keto-3-deoxy-L-rhamnonate aldolase RhmA